MYSGNLDVDSRWQKINNELFPKDFKVILLDTEGLASYTRSETYDVQIFALSLLLSSYFIYNSLGTIDENALDKLSLVVELTKYIRTHSDTTDETGRAFHTFFPRFMWLVRDFSLQLEVDGQSITSNQYLDRALQPGVGDDKRTIDKNIIRKCITDFFSDRECCTLKRPINDETKLQHLENVPVSEFRPEYMREVRELIDGIYTKTQKKNFMVIPLMDPCLWI